MSATSNANPNLSHVRILALTGGGYPGLFSAHVLELLEKIQNRNQTAPLKSSFEILAGTSIGAVIAAAIAHGVPAETIRKSFEEKGELVFPRRRTLRPWVGGAKHSPDGLREVILEHIGEDMRLGDIDKWLVIPAIDETNGEPVLYRSYSPSQEDIRVVDAVLASAAAPTFLPLHTMPSISGGNIRLTDGGLIANAPDLVAALDARNALGCPYENMRMISIAPPSHGRSPYPPSAGVDWGVLKWMRRGPRLIQASISAQMKLTRYVTERLGLCEYHLIEGDSTASEDKILKVDSASPEAIKTIASIAERYRIKIGGDEVTKRNLSRILSKNALKRI